MKLPTKVTLEPLAETVRQLQERVEDLGDLVELRAAIDANAGQPGIACEKAKEELEIDRTRTARPRPAINASPPSYTS